MKNKYKLQHAIVFGVIVALPLLYKSCSYKNEDNSTSSFDTLGMNDFGINIGDSFPQSSQGVKDKNEMFEKKELSNDVGEYNLSRFMDGSNTNIENKTLNHSYYLEDGYIVVYEPCGYLLTNKETVLSNYGLSNNDEISNYSFDRLEEQELFREIEYNEPIIIGTEKDVKVLKFTR